MVFFLGACLLWLAIDALRRRHVLWMEGDELGGESGYARRRDQPLRYWAWVFIWGTSGAMCIGFALAVAWREFG
jgi:hypothetical protein